MGDRNPWTRLYRRVAYDNPWIRIYEDGVLTPAGTPSIYGVLQPKHVALGVLPIESNGDIWLVGQWRYVLDQFSWELPEGGGSPEADPIEEAKRELLEETGLAAENWSQILELHPSNSTSRERALCFLATGLTRVSEPQPDASEADMRVERLPFLDAFAQALDGRITDAMTVAMLLRAYHMAQTGDLEPELARHIL